MSHASDLGHAAQDHVNDLGKQAKAAVTEKAVAQADQVKHTAATKVQQAADAADAAAGKLDPTSPQAQAMQQVADHIEDVAMKLRTADIHQLAHQTTDIARRNPLLFIGAAAFAGFAAARFLKARDPRPMAYTNTTDPWGAPAQHDTVLSQINEGPNHG